MGVMTNTAEISEDYNEYGVPDKDSTPDNKKQGEDDIDDTSPVVPLGVFDGTEHDHQGRCEKEDSPGGQRQRYLGIGIELDLLLRTGADGYDQQDAQNH